LDLVRVPWICQWKFCFKLFMFFLNIFMDRFAE